MPDNKNAELVPLTFLFEHSQTALQNTMLNRLNLADRRRKQVLELLEEWVTAEAEARLLEWFLEHGAEVAAMAISPKVTEITRPDAASKPGPQRAADIRESLRNLLESA